MPLYDHFHGPIARRPWESFHGRWAFAIADDLNRRLPRQFVADAPMHLGTAVSADVAEYEQPSANGRYPVVNTPSAEKDGGIALAVEPYAPPRPTFSMPAEFPPEVKVEVRDQSENYRLLAVIELVSPANKKEAGERERFAAKCLSYLGTGVGLVVIDVVTARSTNLHNVMVHLAEKSDQFLMPDDPPLYVVSVLPQSELEERPGRVSYNPTGGSS